MGSDERKAQRRCRVETRAPAGFTPAGALVCKPENHSLGEWFRGSLLAMMTTKTPFVAAAKYRRQVFYGEGKRNERFPELKYSKSRVLVPWILRRHSGKECEENRGVHQTDWTKIIRVNR